ncbi:MAG: 30S ribosomal protein S6 [Halanaerobiaceae bacterium]
MVRLYETTFIIKPDVEEGVRDEIFDRVKGIITDNDGEIVEFNVWGSKKLAYEIQDYTNGFYINVMFKGTSVVNDELEHNYKIMDDVLRYLILRKED